MALGKKSTRCGDVLEGCRRSETIWRFLATYLKGEGRAPHAGYLSPVSQMKLNFSLPSRFDGIFCSVLLELNSNAGSKPMHNKLESWSDLFTLCTAWPAALEIQNAFRGYAARERRKDLARRRQERIENGCALRIQSRIRIKLAKRRARAQKKRLLEEKVRRKRQAIKDREAKKRAAQKKKKEDALKAIAERKAKAIAEEEERKRIYGG